MLWAFDSLSVLWSSARAPLGQSLRPYLISTCWTIHRLFVRSRASNECFCDRQDEVGQGELVTTLMQLAGALVVVGASGGVGSLSLSPTAVDVALAEKCLTMVQTCLTGTR